MTVTVSTFYKFSPIDNCEGLRAATLDRCRTLGIRGTIIIAREGINATIAGPDEGVRALLGWLRSLSGLTDLTSKESRADDQPFQRLKVKIKPEIVTLRAPEADPARQVGTYVDPKEWNDLIGQPDVVVIDARNAYEVAIGRFEGAVDPGTRAFTDFPAFVRANLDPQATPKVAMYCTGGIRCEKASALMLGLGFPEVYHLDGGILKYLETIPAEQSLWRGECFVFDERVAVEHGVREGSHALCRRCGHPVAQARAPSAKPQLCVSCIRRENERPA